MSGYTDQVTRELLALTEPDPLGTGIDRDKVRQMLSDAWEVGMVAGYSVMTLVNRMDDIAAAVNPFRVAVNG